MKRIVGLSIATVTALSLMAGGAQAVKTVSPEVLTFPPTPRGGESAPQTVTIGIGAEDTFDRTTRPFIDGSCGAGGCEYKVAGTTCPVFPSTFSAGSSTCTFSIVMAPPSDAPSRPNERGFTAGAGWQTVILVGTVAEGGTNKGSKKKCGKKGKKSASAAGKKKGCKKKKK